MSKGPPRALTLLRARQDAARAPSKKMIAKVNEYHAMAKEPAPSWDDFDFESLNEPPAPSVKRIRRALPGESEAEILKAIMKLLRHHPKVARVWRQSSGSFKLGVDRYFQANTARGMSDIMGILKDGARTLAIEVKTKTGKVAEHQQEFLDSVTRAGGIAFVARSVDDVVERLK